MCPESDLCLVSYSIKLDFECKVNRILRDSIESGRADSLWRRNATDWCRTTQKSAGQIVLRSWKQGLFASLALLFIVALHSQVQPITHLVEKIGAAIILATFHIRIGVVTMALLDFYSE